MQRWSVFQITLLFMLAMTALVIMAEPAFAQAVGGAGNYQCSGGRATGSLYSSGASCPTTFNEKNVFSFLICNMEQLSSNLMGQMFCGVIHDLTPAVYAVLTLAVVIFGTGFTIGLIPATARDFQSFLLKAAFITVFATQADYLVNYGYGFLVNGIRDGVAVTLGAMQQNASGVNIATGTDIYALLDGFLAKAIGYATDAIGATKADGTNDYCKNAIFAVLAIMAVAFPPIFYISLLIIVKIAITFLRAVFGYIYAIIGIAFLLTLSPIFLSFYFFRQTRQFFEKWLGYLASFTLQMVFVFAFLAFILTLDVKHISGSIVNLIIPVEETPEGTSLRMPWEYCTLCEFEVVDATTKQKINWTKYDSFIGKGELQCTTNPGKPITITAMAAPEGGNAPSTALQGALLKFAGTGLLSLFILAYVVDALLRYSASLAQYLAGGLGGAAYAPQLGGGYSLRGNVLQMPGERALQTIEGGFNAGFKKSNNSAGGFVSGMKDVMSALQTGRTYGADGKMGTGTVVRDEQGNPIGNVGENFISWLSDPHRIRDN